jgi:hypothetical protein
MPVSNPLPTPPGYSGLAVLDRNLHRNLGIAESGRARLTAQLHSIPVAAVEINHAARHYPVVFAQDSANGRYVPVAVTALAAQDNLFVGPAGWAPFCYVPAYVRRWPFFSLPVTPREGEAAAGSAVICVDPAGLVADAPALFDAEGQGTEAWRPYDALVREMETARGQTEALLATLKEHRLLEPFDAMAYPQAGRSLHLTGMHRVSEQRLNALEGRVLKGLAKRGELSRIYAHLISLDNFRYLLDRTAARDRATAATGAEHGR